MLLWLETGFTFFFRWFIPVVYIQQCLVENIGRQSIHNENFIRCRYATVVDYMFRPFSIRPSSGLVWRTKE